MPARVGGPQGFADRPRRLEPAHARRHPKAVTMHSIPGTSGRMVPPPAEEGSAHRPDDVDSFLVDDRGGPAVGRPTVRFEVCPVTKTILGFELSSDRRSTSRRGTVAAPGRTRKGKAAPGNTGAWPRPGMPGTVVIDCPEFDAPTFRDAVMGSGETRPDPGG